MGGRIVIADDDVLLREGVASVLTGAGFEVAGQAGDAAGIEALVRAAAADLAVLDIRMPPTHTTEGLEAARALREALPEVGILLLSAHVDVDTATDLLARGQRIGYLLKSRVARVADLVDAVQRILDGGVVIDPAVVQELLTQRHRRDPLAELTAREREVLGLMAEGRSNAGIARALWVTESAVEKHVRSIMVKLQLPAGDGDHRRVLAVVAYLDA
jgi:DNA-binding NarL/FixJ family response regulator